MVLCNLHRRYMLPDDPTHSSWYGSVEMCTSRLSDSHFLGSCVNVEIATIAAG